MTEIENTLKEIGFNDEETKVYLLLLKEESALASKISQSTKLNRSFVYQILTQLIQKGFVSYTIKNNIRYYSAVSPDKLVDIIKEKQEKLISILPKLKSLSEPSQQKPLVEVLEGREGIKTIMKDILKVKEEWCAFGSSGKAKEILSYYVDHWEKERQKSRIKLRAVIDTSDASKKRGKELAKMNYTKIKYTKEYSSPSSTWIYGDRIAIIVWSKENPFAIRIKSKEIMESYRNYFEYLWKVAK